MSNVIPTRARSMRRLGAAMSAIGLLAIASCSAGTSPGTTAGGDGPVIGVAMKTQQERRWAFDFAAMEKQVTAMGGSVLVQWANNDAEAQTEQVENLLSQGIDALILVPVDDKAAGTAANAARAEGVPVISYGVAVQGVPVDYMVLRDNHAVGRLQAQAALEFAPTGNYAIISGDPGNDVARYIREAVLETLEGTAPKVVYDEFTKKWDPTLALSESENILSTNNDDIAAILTANDGMAVSAVQALKGRNLAGKVFVSGMNADPANLKLVDQGAQTMTVWTPIDVLGKLAGEVAVKLAKGEKVEPQSMVDNGSGAEIPAVEADVVPITKDTICKFITEIAPEGWIKASDVYDDPAKACPNG